MKKPIGFFMEWQSALERLETDRLALVGHLDWITKLWLLETFMEEEKLQWTDPWLASLDLEYHNVNPDRGLFLILEKEQRVKRLVDEAEIVSAMDQGPADTRGGLRGLCIKRFGPMIRSVQWEGIEFKGLSRCRQLDFKDTFDPGEIIQLRKKIEEARTPSELFTT